MTKKTDDQIGEENLKKGTKLPEERKVGPTEEQKKKIRFLILLVVAGTVTMFGLTFFAQALSYDGIRETAGEKKGDGRWDIAFVDMQKISQIGEAAEISQPTYNNLHASFYVTLNRPGDEIKYSLTVANRGTINARLNSINIVPPNDEENDPFLYYVDGIKVGDFLDAGQKTPLTVTVKYNDKAKSDITAKKSAEVILNYVQR